MNTTQSLSIVAAVIVAAVIAFFAFKSNEASVTPAEVFSPNPGEPVSDTARYNLQGIINSI